MSNNKQLKKEEQINNKEKREYLYKLWEHHSNLLWNKIQSVFVIMAAFYTAWFLLFDKMLQFNSGKDFLYLILITGMCFLVLHICYYFKQLMSRDTKQQQRIEQKDLDSIFEQVKNNSETPEDEKGRVIIQKMMNLCIFSCICLLLLSVIYFHIHRFGQFGI